MKAALMWTISNFPAYSMLSGWSTSEKLACPYCMKHSQAFTLTNGRKTTWFDNHRKFPPFDHAFRHNKNSFLKNRIEMAPLPPIMTGEQVAKQINDLGLKKLLILIMKLLMVQFSRLVGGINEVTFGICHNGAQI